MCVCMCVCVCGVCVCVCVCGSMQHGSVVVVLGSQTKGCEFESHLSFAVLILSNSLYPTYFSVPSYKIGTWLWLGC